MSFALPRQQPKNSKMITEQTFKCFSKIVDFVAQLKDVFTTDGKYHEITLYNHLLTKTKVSNKAAINRHVEVFADFCTRNQDAILNKDPKRIVQHRIAYSEKAFIDLYTVLNQPDLDEETVNTIWTHLLVIQATVDPTSEARAILQRLKENSSSEGQFLDSFLTKIESSIDKDKVQSDPLSAATSILQSGVLNDLVGSIDKGVKGGNLDLGKLVGTVQQMLGGITGQMGAGDGSAGAPGLDLGGLMSGMMGLMGNMGAAQGAGMDPRSMLSGMNPDKIKDQIEAQVENEMKRIQTEETSRPRILELKDDPVVSSSPIKIEEID